MNTVLKMAAILPRERKGDVTGGSHSMLVNILVSMWDGGYIGRRNNSRLILKRPLKNQTITGQDRKLESNETCKCFLSLKINLITNYLGIYINSLNNVSICQRRVRRIQITQLIQKHISSAGSLIFSSICKNQVQDFSCVSPLCPKPPHIQLQT